MSSHNYPTNPPVDVSAGELARVHMVGIGGAGMSGVARILLDRGYEVSGSDMKDSRAILALRAAGAQVAIGHDASNLDLLSDTPTCVVTSFAAIPKDNPELARARELGIPVVKRSDVLGALLRGYESILIAGTHGKTSTTSMCVVALQQAGVDPSFAIGGQLSAAGTNAHHGSGSVFVAEADESDASLLTYEPTVAVVTNMEADHLDFYGSAEAYLEVFDEFAGKISDGGYLVVCADDENAAQLGMRVHTSAGDRINVVGYGTAAAFDSLPDLPRGVVIDSITPGAQSTTAALTVSAGGSTTRHVIDLYIPGTHMVLNAAAAVLSGALVGADREQLANGISNFRGVRRRFDYHGTIASGPFEGASVYDDYAHHPTEVRAVLTAARERVEARGAGERVVVVFQPHLYSRTREFATEFADALSLADEAVILDIYGAREQPMDGVSSELIIDTMTIPAHAAHRFDSVPDQVKGIAQAGDVIVTMGAGTVTMLADPIISALSEDAQADSDADQSAGSGVAADGDSAQGDSSVS